MNDEDAAGVQSSVTEKTQQRKGNPYMADITLIVDTEMIDLVRSCISTDPTKEKLLNLYVTMVGDHKRLVATDTWKLLMIDFIEQLQFSSLTNLNCGMYRIKQVTKKSNKTSTVVFTPIPGNYVKYERTLPEQRQDHFRSMTIGLYRSWTVKINDREETHWRFQVRDFCGDLKYLPKQLINYTVKRHTPFMGGNDLYTFHNLDYKGIYYLLLGLEKK